MNQLDNTDLPHCSLLRRLAAILYDSLLLLAVLFIADAIWLLLSGGKVQKGFHPFFSIYLLMITFAFFAWFWSHGGQTLGMRAWRIRLRNRNPGQVSLWQLMLRFLIAILSWLAFGLGFLWSLIDKEKLTWHDRYSMTELVVEPKDKGRK